MTSPDLTAANVDKIAELFPNVLTEVVDGDQTVKRAIDFDLLRQELSEHIVEGPQERYQLNWPGKRAAAFAANAPIAKTLRPVREESVDFDTTKNLFVEGDNLDALKLLQESYLGKVKLIYIDPPYNTGNDFVYADDFAESNADYLEKSGQLSGSGERLVANTEANGRFHSNWLSMMYPRLKMARSMLRDDGVIFASIDDKELATLRILFDEVFGADNFLATIVWKNATDNNPTRVAVEHEYLLCYARNKSAVAPVWKSADSAARDLLVAVGDELTTRFTDPEDLQAEYSAWFRENKGVLGPLDRYKYIDADGVYTGSQSVHNPGKEGYRYEVIHPVSGKSCKQPLLGYRFPEETMKRLIEEGRILFGADENKIVELKVYAKDFKQKLASVIELDGRLGANELRVLFPKRKVFTNPKPVSLLRDVFSFVVAERDIVLDFFAGSGTTADAVLRINATLGTRARFVLVQLPERASEGGFRTLADVTKERIRRTGKRIKEGNATYAESVDIGFRVLKVDTSNLVDTLAAPGDLSQDTLISAINSVMPDRTGEDLLFQVLLDWGLELSLSISRERLDDHEVFVVDDGALIACFDEHVDLDMVRAVAKREPLRAVFRDSAFVSDDVRINTEQIFREISPATDVKTV
ncbi:MAG TPA: site-specific DNA-methyltransferase [Flexivirga sp.]|uniref:site-specific DNA-methyltransferase n=1 Tax=Flexivirga sp. TaxID=1962927 RepID=UPI002B692A91|nr:site-specific DNA-methyltransferase [Flexivirga sp.]HWC23846.1 site-specific DNA-methyltransferase [Flexivirga sp.]